MTKGWTLKSLFDAVELQRGFDLPATQRVSGKVPVVASTSIVGRHNEAKVSAPGVVIGRSGSIGGAQLVNEDFWPLNTTLWVKDFRGNDVRFVYHLLKSIDFSAFNAGSGVPTLNRNHLTAIRVWLPPLEEQRRIAWVLGALDDLIEVNRGIIIDLIATADAIAQSVASQGEIRTFGDVCDVFGGGTPSTKNSQYWNGDIRWATPTDMTALPSPYLFDTSRRITVAGLEACASKLMPKGSILMTSRATIGAFAIAQEPTAVNQGFIAIEPRQEIDRWFLFHEMRRRVPEFIQRANGSTFLELSRGVFKALEVNWPAESVRADLFAKVDPLHRAAASLQQEIAELHATRDELLPLLMSGRVRVAEEVAA